MALIKKMFCEKLGPMLVVLGVGTAALCISCYVYSQNTAICYPIEIWSAACDNIDFFLPLIAVLPFTFSLYEKRKKKFLDYVAVRMEKKKYISLEILSGELMTILMVFLMYYISLIFTITFLPIQEYIDRPYLIDYLFGFYQVNYPYLFGFFWCLWKGVVASLFTGFGYGLSLCVDNLFIVIVTPFIYCVIENLVTGILGIPQFSIITSYVLNRLTPEVMHIWNIFAGTISYVGVTTIILLFLKWKRSGIYDNQGNQE